MQSKVFVRFLVSYIIVLLVPLCLGLVVYFKASAIVETEATRSNLAILQQTSQVMDGHLKEVKQLAQQIALDKGVNDFVYVRAPLNNGDRYKQMLVLDQFSFYRNFNSFVYDFYVYFKNSDIVLTSSSKYEPLMFYDYLYAYEGISYKTWHDDFLRHYYYGEYVSGKTVNLSANRHHERLLTYAQSISLGDNASSDAVIAVLIDEQVIRQLLENMAGEGRAYIIDQNDRLIMSSHDEDGYIPVYQELNSNQGFLLKEYNGDNLSITYTSSHETNWKYVIVTPRSIFMDKVDYIRTLTLWVFVGCLIVGLFIACFFAYKNYNPIKRLVRLLFDRMGKGPQKNSDEVDFIEQAVLTTMEYDKDLKSKLDQQRPVLKAHLLLKLLKGNLDDDHAIQESLTPYDIDFSYQRFVVILFHIDDCSQFVQSDFERGWALIRLVVTNVVEELVNKNHKGYMVELDDVLALIMNLCDDVDDNDAKMEVRALLSDAKIFLEKRYKTFIAACAGDIHDGIKGIKLSYNEALKAMDYKIARGSGAIIFFDEICHVDKDYYYPLDIEKQLVNCVKAGDVEEVDRLLKDIFEENFIKRNLHPRLLQAIFFNIITTAIKTLNEISVDYDKIFRDGFDPMDKLLQCQTVGEMRSAIQEVYGRLCSYINEHKKSHNSKLKEQILEYIESHYTDENFSQAAMAEELNITSPYLSNFFKEQFGENMIDYINKMRVNKAKQLLKENERLTISKAATAVGCYNDKALIRIFKKYEGTTPGKYREVY